MARRSLNPYLFIVGSPRSGTTMLKRMLDEHRDLAITRETHWIPRFFERSIGLDDQRYVTPEIVPALFEYPRFQHLKISRTMVEDVILQSDRLSYADFVSRLFDLYGERKQKRLVGDKTPGYVRKIGVLHQLWPRTRFIHIIRDGRDVTLSMLTWRMAHRAAGRRGTWEEDPVTTTALWWEWHIRLGREAGGELSDGLYRELMYEDLVADTENCCRSVCGHLDLDFDDSMLRYYEGKTRDASDLSANGAWLPPTQGLRDWHTQMTPEDQERFEAASGALLDELGYERAVSHPSAAALEHAKRLRARFDGRPLPASW